MSRLGTLITRDTSAGVGITDSRSGGIEPSSVYAIVTENHLSKGSNRHFMTSHLRAS